MTPVDIFNSLTPKEKAQVLATLRQSEPTCCERLGHKYKVSSRFKAFLQPMVTTYVCERCGKSITK
jgi:hypothetical protein